MKSVFSVNLYAVAENVTFDPRLSVARHELLTIRVSISCSPDPHGRRKVFGQ